MLNHTWLIKICRESYKKVGSTASQAYCLAVNKIRKVLLETGLRYPSSVLRLGCTRLRRFIPTPRCSLGHHTILSRAAYLSTGASRSQGALECLVRTIKQELWIEYLDWENLDFYAVEK